MEKLSRAWGSLHSENRIKELQVDFAASVMPCKDFNADALFFSLCTLAYNMFVLFRMYIPAYFEAARARLLDGGCLLWLVR